MLPDHLEEMAAEYVLGTLSAGERREAEQLMSQDPQFAKAIHDWERRLSPLGTRMTSVAPPAHMRDRVLRAIGGGGEVVALRRKISLWRSAAFAASALAATLAGVTIWLAQPEEQARYVAVLQPDTQGPAFIATVDMATGFISVRRVQAETPEGKSYELWAVGGGRSAPQSLGLIDKDVRADVQLTPDTILAVSLEPAGGSPTGQPTGPIVYQGRLVKTE
jgi:anti-sigma-K factor RskA